MLSHDRLLEVLWYCPETGKFIWQNSPRKGWDGKVAGSPCSGGYLQILVDKHPYRAHRLAWLYVTGKWPEGDIDHINRDKKDNRWNNLREVSRSENCRNKGIQKNNTSGVPGVSFSTSSSKWVVQTTVYGKRVRHTFKTFEEAVAFRKMQEPLGGYI